MIYQEYLFQNYQDRKIEEEYLKIMEEKDEPEKIQRNKNTKETCNSLENS